MNEEKKLTVRCLCGNEDCMCPEDTEDPYLEIARENAEAVELRNEAERLTQHND